MCVCVCVCRIHSSLEIQRGRKWKIAKRIEGKRNEKKKKKILPHPISRGAWGEVLYLYLHRDWLRTYGVGRGEKLEPVAGRGAVREGTGDGGGRR